MAKRPFRDFTIVQIKKDLQASADAFNVEVSELKEYAKDLPESLTSTINQLFDELEGRDGEIRANLISEAWKEVKSTYEDLCEAEGVTPYGDEKLQLTEEGLKLAKKGKSRTSTGKSKKSGDAYEVTILESENEGETYEAVSGADALKWVNDKLGLDPKNGAGNSAPRVLAGMSAKGQIKLDIVEKKTVVTKAEESQAVAAGQDSDDDVDME